MRENEKNLEDPSVAANKSEASEAMRSALNIQCIHADLSNAI